ncbi:hypothetical protein M080_4917 [Bacteroides fragilis str. 3397 T10]|nr:hypothetical protein M080_4917 [Bacteroides fragilis str. 3397 T10]
MRTSPVLAIFPSLAFSLISLSGTDNDSLPMGGTVPVNP